MNEFEDDDLGYEDDRRYEEEREPEAEPEIASAPDDGPGESNYTPGPKERECSFLGVSKTGKTFLLGAINQACQLSGINGYRLSFTPKHTQHGGQATSDLIANIMDQIISTPDSIGEPATILDSDYVFNVNCKTTSPWSPIWLLRRLAALLFSVVGARDFAEERIPKSESEIRFSVSDTPGGRQFGSRPDETIDPVAAKSWDNIRTKLQSSSKVVICVDASDPDLKSFATGYMKLLEASQGPRDRLKASQLLLLLTKVDVLVDRLLDSARNSLAIYGPRQLASFALEVIGDDRMMTSRKLAETINPVDTARAVLGQATLSMIRRSIDDDAEMGIGVCSSTGFYESGQSFWQNLPPTDMPSKERGNFQPGPRRLAGMTRDDAYRNWRPFGVEEMILFLTTGRFGRTIQPYTWKDDAAASKRRAFVLRPLQPVMTGRPQLDER